jgi:hypothetical protein
MYARNRVHGIALNTDEVAIVRLPSVLELAPVPGNNYHVVDLLWQQTASADPQDIDRLQGEIAELRATNARHVQAYAVLPATAEETVIFEKLNGVRTEFWGTVDHVMSISRLGTPASNEQARDIVEHRLTPRLKTLSLAQRSADAAKEIKNLIQDSLHKVEKGSELVNRSGETLQGIIGTVKRVTGIVGEIAAASAEQSIGVDQVNTAITQMDHVTQSNSAQTDELSSTAQSLAEQAARLTQLVGQFKLGGYEHERKQRVQAAAPEASKWATTPLPPRMSLSSGTRSG